MHITSSHATCIAREIKEAIYWKVLASDCLKTRRTHPQQVGGQSHGHTTFEKPRDGKKEKYVDNSDAKFAAEGFIYPQI